MQRAQATGISWPLPVDLDDAQLEGRLYPPKPRATAMVLPDFQQIQRELSRPGVTHELLWREYKIQQPDGLGYTAFCVRYRRWLKGAHPVMRFEHRAGEKLFVDYAGHTVPIIDQHSGEISQEQM